MRKRSGRPPKYAAVPNETIDDADQLDFMALALLTVLIRHRDGWDVTLERIGKKYGYGREALSKAMGLLMVARYVVKVRMMSAQGNQWSTEVYVYDTPATDAEVAALLAAVEREPEVVRSEVIQPTKTALDHAKARKTKLAPKESARQGPSVAVPRVPENPHSGATCGNGAEQQVAPECRDSRQSGDPAVFKKTVVQKTVDETEDALAARSAPDGRRPSEGSSTDDVEGGCAASSNTKPSPTTDTPSPAGSQAAPRHSKQQLDLVRAVRAHFPANLLNGWTNPTSGQVIPPLPDVPVLSQAILDALEGDVPAADRTVEQLGARIVQRWNHHGWGEKYYRCEIDRLVGAAVALVRPLKASDRYGCANPRCEAGKDADTGVDCHVCPKRLEDRRTDRKESQERHVPAPRPASPPPTRTPFRECACRNPIPKGSDDTMCRDCRRQADSGQLVGVQGPAPF